MLRKLYLNADKELDTHVATCLCCNKPMLIINSEYDYNESDDNCYGICTSCLESIGEKQCLVIESLGVDAQHKLIGSKRTMLVDRDESNKSIKIISHDQFDELYLLKLKNQN